MINIGLEPVLLTNEPPTYEPESPRPAASPDVIPRVCCRTAVGKSSVLKTLMTDSNAPTDALAKIVATVATIPRPER